MSSDNEPTWSLCKKAVWMLIQNSDNLADAEELLNRPEDPDLHVACGKCFILLLVAVRTLKKTRLEDALAEFKRLEARCKARAGAGGWMRAVGRRLFPAAAAATVDDYDRRIAQADAAACAVGLTLAAHWNGPSVATVARAVYALRRAWKMYQQCYAAVLDVYRNVYDLDQNTPRWPPVLRRRQSFTLAPASCIGSRMLRSATTSFEMLRQNSASNVMPNDVVRLMAAISTGYGAFNLMVSLLPPTVVSVIGMFGFCGNRQTGLDALAFAKNGPDVHAPLAWVILSWYRMVGNTDFLFDGPRSRENESCVREAEQLVLNPPEEFRNSTSLQYFTGRSRYLKGDLDGAIRAYELGSTIDERGFVNMKAMYSHELSFMYAIRLDWAAACGRFADVAGDTAWMRSYHYVLASACAGAAGDVATARLMWRRSKETSDAGRPTAERDTVADFVADGKRTLASALSRTTSAAGDGGRRCRLLVYEALYVKYGVAAWPADALHAVLTDCRESEDGDDATIRYTKEFLAIVCRKALLGRVDDGRHRSRLAEFVEHVERDKRRDHLYAFGLFELAAEQISSPETVDEGKLTIQKLNSLKGPYHFQYFYEMRCASLQAYVQKSNGR